MKREHKLKIIAFLISATLWYFVVWGKPVEKVIEVPIIVKGNYESKYLWEINPTTVTLKLLATRNQLRDLDKNKLQIELDLLHYPPGIHQVRVPIEKINLPERIKVKEVSPNFLSLVIRKVSSKKVPIKMNLINQPPLKSFKVLLNPSFATIKGFWDDIKEIEEISTEEVDFETLKREKAFTVKLIVPNRVLEVIPDRVKILYISH